MNKGFFELKRVSERTFERHSKKSRRIKTVTWHKMGIVRTRACMLRESFYPTPEVHYSAVVNHMATLLGIVDRKSVLAYLGRPEYVQRVFMDQLVTYQKSGTVVPKRHSFQRKIKAKKGYIELFDLGHVYVKEGEWWIRWNHKELVNEVFSRPSQTKGECVGVSHGNVDDEKVTMQNISPPNMDIDEQGKTAPKNMRMDREKEREEREYL